MKILIILLSICVQLSYSQSVRKDLIKTASEAYEVKDYLNTALNLYAFREINKDYLEENEPNKLKEINGIIEFSLKQIVNIRLDYFKPEPINVRRTNVILEAKTADGLEQSMNINGLKYKIKSIELQKSE